MALWLRGGAPRLLPLERPLAEAGVATESTLDLAAALPRVRPLPSRVAGAVPDGSSAAVSLRPPGAFSVSARVCVVSASPLMQPPCVWLAVSQATC